MIQMLRNEGLYGPISSSAASSGRDDSQRTEKKDDKEKASKVSIEQQRLEVAKKAAKAAEEEVKEAMIAASAAASSTEEVKKAGGPEDREVICKICNMSIWKSQYNDHLSGLKHKKSVERQQAKERKEPKTAEKTSTEECLHEVVKQYDNQPARWTKCEGCGARLSYESKKTGKIEFVGVAWDGSQETYHSTDLDGKVIPDSGC